jgi:hypothetical protein
MLGFLFFLVIHIMSSKYLERTFLGIFLAVGLIAFHQWLALRFPTQSAPPHGAGDWATWLGAIGTILTLVGTIWLATKQNRDQRRQAWEAARLTAHQMYFQYLHDEGNTIAAVNALRAAITEGKDLPKAYALGCNELAIQRLQRVVIRQITDLMPLTVLPEECASRIVGAQGRVVSTLHLLREAHAVEDSQDALIDYLATNYGILQTAASQMTQVIAIFQQIIDSEAIRSDQ